MKKKEYEILFYDFNPVKDWKRPLVIVIEKPQVGETIQIGDIEYKIQKIKHRPSIPGSFFNQQEMNTILTVVNI